MIDIILGDVFVVLARFLATDVVTLRCNRPFDMVGIFFLLPAYRCLRNPRLIADDSRRAREESARAHGLGRLRLKWRGANRASNDDPSVGSAISSWGCKRASISAAQIRVVPQGHGHEFRPVPLGHEALPGAGLCFVPLGVRNACSSARPADSRFSAKTDRNVFSQITSRSRLPRRASREVWKPVVDEKTKSARAARIPRLTQTRIE